MNTYLKELDRYGEVLTKEQMRIVCHISKRKAAYLLQSGLVPCINTGKKTHTYIIKKTDVIDYLCNRIDHPWMYQVKQSNAAHKRIKFPIKQFPSIFDVISEKRMRMYFRRKLLEYPDILTAAQIEIITGYCENTVRAWLAKGELDYLDCIAGWRIPKVWLIDFLCSPYYNKIARKTQKHLMFLSEMIGG